MKKIFLCVFLFFLWCNLSLAERVTWGFVGDSCEKFTETKKEYGEEFDSMFESEIMGFLTGINIYIADTDGNTNRVKLLDHNSIDYAYSNLTEYCRKNTDGYVFFGLLEYYNSLPEAK